MKLVKGIWFPAAEEHLTEMVRFHSKVGEVDGKGTYQLHKLRRALDYLPPERFRTAVDIGGHIGLWSMHLVKLFEQLQAFEPVPDLADLFVRNVSDGYVLHQFALGAEPGEVTLDLRPHDTGNTHVVPTDPGAPKPKGDPLLYTVPVKTLDGCAFDEVDFVKIDVEGWEAEVVKGARETLLRCKPVVVCEQKGNDAKWYGRPKDEAVGLLKDLGMRVADNLAGDHIMVW